MVVGQLEYFIWIFRPKQTPILNLDRSVYEIWSSVIPADVDPFFDVDRFPF